MGELVLGLLDVLSCRALFVNAAWLGALEDVFLAGGEMGEDFGGELEVFGDDGLGGVCYEGVSD